MSTPSVDHHHEECDSKVVFGFWIYVMTDFIFFAALFATYIVLRNSTYGGPSIAEITRLSYVFSQTIVLLLSAFAYGLSFVALHRNNQKQLFMWLGLAVFLILIFLGLQWHDLSCLVAQGITWQKSAFLSAYFTLQGLFWIHASIAFVWAVILAIQLKMQGLNFRMRTRFTCLSLFWNFLTLLWLVIFTIVYLMGVI